MRSLCNWLYKNNCIVDNPISKVSPPRRQRKLLPATSKEQLETILGKAVCFRDKCIIRLLFDSGIRVSEIARIQASDFNWDDATVVILGKGNKQRRAIFTNHTAIMLKEWFKEYDSFGISMAGIQTMLKRLAKDTGIPCHPHSFRTGFCVHQVKQGLSTRVVQALGGWENITMVERYSKSLSFDDAFRLDQQVNGR
ncbi:tyrosine-type recombinase/integrase [Chloroflexota bacterium]